MFTEIIHVCEGEEEEEEEEKQSAYMYYIYSFGSVFFSFCFFVCLFWNPSPESIHEHKSHSLPPSLSPSIKEEEVGRRKEVEE